MSNMIDRLANEISQQKIGRWAQAWMRATWAAFVLTCLMTDASASTGATPACVMVVQIPAMSRPPTSAEAQAKDNEEMRHRCYSAITALLTHRLEGPHLPNPIRVLALTVVVLHDAHDLPR